MKNETPAALAAVGKRKYPSSIEVARLAGVSQSAVSRTFTEGASVSKETREKVEKAAMKLGYRPSAIPRIMLTHRSNLVAVAAGELDNPMMAALLAAYTKRLQQEGLQVMLYNLEFGERLDEFIPHIASFRVDAIFITRCLVSKQAADECEKFNIPIISFYPERQPALVSSVAPDDYDGGKKIAEHFVKFGASKFGFLSGWQGDVASEMRLRGYREGLALAGKSVATIAYGTFQYRSGFDAATEMFSKPDRPDAVFCAGDLIACGAIDALRKKNLRVPEDIMIAGFDDIPQASWEGYNLTTIRQSVDQIVDKSIEMFQRQMRGKLKRGTREIIPVELIARGSTARHLA